MLRSKASLVAIVACLAGVVSGSSPPPRQALVPRARRGRPAQPPSPRRSPSTAPVREWSHRMRLHDVPVDLPECARGRPLRCAHQGVGAGRAVRRHARRRPEHHGAVKRRQRLLGSDHVRGRGRREERAGGGPVPAQAAPPQQADARDRAPRRCDAAHHVRRAGERHGHLRHVLNGPPAIAPRRRDRLAPPGSAVSAPPGASRASRASSAGVARTTGGRRRA